MSVNELTFFLVEIFFIIMPIVDNINGYLQVNNKFSVLGPVFRVSFLIIISLLFILNKQVKKINLIKYILLIVGMMLLHFLYYALNYSLLGDIRDLLKVFYPLFLFHILKSIVNTKKFNPKTLYRLKNSMIISLNIYSLFILFSFLIKYKMFSNKEGYYGFVYDLNGLMLIYIIMLPILMRNKVKNILLNAGCYLLTASKGTIFFILGLVYGYIKANKEKYNKNKFKIFILSLIIIVVVVIFMILSPSVQSYYVEHSYYLQWDWSYMLKYNLDVVLNNLTYGRSDFVLSFFNNFHNKSLLEHIIGSGINKAQNYIIGGRYLTEMDLVDALNLNGIIGIFIYIYIYFYNLKYIDKTSRRLLYVALAYSLIGGHLYIGAIANLYYVVVILLLRYMDKNTINEGNGDVNASVNNP